MTESTTQDKKPTKCLFLVSEKGKWGVNEHLKPYKPIYNGAGWFIEDKHRDIVLQISEKAGMRVLEWTLNEPFEDLRRQNKRGYLQEKSIKTRLAIDGLRATLGILEIDPQTLLQSEDRANLEQISDGKKLLEHIEEYNHLLEQIKFAEEEEKISKIEVKKQIQIISTDDRFKTHKEILEKYRGKKHLGLCVKTLDVFNGKMLGLRKLILLAAAPNVGKTALTIQLGKEVLLTEPDACLIYVSLEMDAEEIFTRMMLYHSGLDFDTYVLGSQQTNGENGYQNFFSQEELRKIDTATKIIEKIGDRLQIIDASTCSHFTADVIIKYIEELKSKTGCSRAIVIIDYLQVWPIPEGLRFTSDVEADKWRIGEVKKIRDALNKVNQDPVIVISEARKPSNKEDTWGGDLSDVMGSARGTYTPDAVLFLSPLQPAQLTKLWEEKVMPEINYKDDEHQSDKDKNLIGFLAHHGIAICSLKMPKGRDGMKKFNILLAFHFHKNKFEPIDWQSIMGLAMREKNKDKQPSPYSKDENGYEIICKL